MAALVWLMAVSTTTFRDPIFPRSLSPGALLFAVSTGTLLSIQGPLSSL
jgi:hypothetical protein